MEQAFKMREHNIKPHVDIEVDIIMKKNGQMTFTLRINNGNIVDYSPVEYVDVNEKYGDITRLIPEVREKPRPVR